MRNPDQSWKPSASFNEIRRRADLLRSVREYFFEEGVMEIEAPYLSVYSTVDPHIQSFVTDYCPVHSTKNQHYLCTSPEFPMKRLLAAGSDDIYSLGKVFRNGEAGGRHNPEFTMLEWYRLGLDHHALMNDVSRLLKACCDFREADRVSYKVLFREYFDIDPHSVSDECLMKLVTKHIDSELTELSRNTCLDLLFNHGIEPHLGSFDGNILTGVYVYDYPESMAALSKIIQNSEGQNVAARFELFIAGMELANGYYELTDFTEQEHRFQRDQNERKQAGLPVTPYDYNLLAAMKSGLPICAGVALGIDRLHMVLAKTDHIRDVIAFDFERA